jgi:tetratricopeptide (TPR) repeat protein
METWAKLCGESDRPQEGISVLQDYLNEDVYARQNDASAWALLGQYHYEEGKLKEGLEYCDTALKIRPDFALGYYTRACAYMRLMQYNEALADIAKAAELHSPLKEQMAEDNDFVPLRDMPEFKKAVKKNNNN